MSKKPIVAFTMGDPSGIGPEICVKAALSKKVLSVCSPVIFGDPLVIKKAGALIGKKVHVISGDLDTGEGRKICVVSAVKHRGKIKPGVVSSLSGLSAMKCIDAALQSAAERKVSGIVTAPISKESIKKAGYNFPGHTEYLAARTGTKDFAMMLIGGNIRTALVTTHLPLKEVAGRLTVFGIYRKILVLNNGMMKMGFRRPRIAVCALNPHAGENGRFGSEEQKIIKPAIIKAARKNIDCSGPFPADTVFYFANKKKYDAVLAMYHDQGLIPVKMLGFEDGVNITLGLPFIRTSPDHGTAFDIAWKNKASSKSMEAAAILAVKLAKNKLITRKK
ncbi:MAG: 4-hydroxythreonine-4-phosphate dehydrogenase PdxA [Candidatus Aureabacteria bacterium]|nr:4-hydroxythreonine-4-phosphate dehydrogenase PdxA [Candidatus Auribacterota bacterium]